MLTPLAASVLEQLCSTGPDGVQGGRCASSRAPAASRKVSAKDPLPICPLQVVRAGTCDRASILLFVSWLQAHTSGAADERHLRRKPGTSAGGTFCGGAPTGAAEAGDLLPQAPPRTRSAGAASDARKGGNHSPHFNPLRIFKGCIGHNWKMLPPLFNSFVGEQLLAGTAHHWQKLLHRIALGQAALSRSNSADC